MTDAVIIQHIGGEGPGPLLLSLLEECGLECTIARMDEGDAVPRHAEVMIVLGGPMNVYEEETHPYLADLDRAVRGHVRAGGHYLGLCLGGQVLAKALGAPVTRAPLPEFGVHTLSLTREGRQDSLFAGVPRSFPTLEWHRDTFAVPCGATLLATSASCRNQAFRFRNAYGLQFHPEMTVGTFETMADDYDLDLRRAGFSADAVVAYARGWEEEMDQHSRQILGNFLDGVVTG
ncbi:type 1 glutamine amidotransferase [Methanofollis ethanolicus]|uniref:type 1 glutamine amidotransferase n=1 Tax=Methanofollis ethanolicus TaxID=488124 RepID=UPI0008358D04|nr:type 1 glutamine amidotransferase [Methanofollis ethanolicus]